MKFKVEREEVETMESLNKVLLENMLPAHVAKHFVKKHMKSDVSMIFFDFYYLSQVLKTRYNTLTYSTIDEQNHHW